MLLGTKGIATTMFSIDFEEADAQASHRDRLEEECKRLETELLEARKFQEPGENKTKRMKL